MKVKYEIRYNHRSTETANSMKEALWTVKNEARQNRLSYATGGDGETYCYRNAADRNRDADGSRAFAMICAAEKN